MKSVRLFPVIAVVIGTLLLLIAFAEAYKNSPVAQISGGAIVPKSHAYGVCMDSQKVTVRLGRMTYEVDAVFRLKNTGSTATVKVGAPKHGYESDFMRLGRILNGLFAPSLRCPEYPDFLHFGCWVDDRKVEVAEEPGWLRRQLNYVTGLFSSEGRSIDRWLVCNVTILGHSTTTIRISYEACYEEGVVMSANYGYGEAAHWPGTIGRISLTMEWTDVHFRVAPLGSEWETLSTERQEAHEIRNYEPMPYESLRFEVDY